MATHEQFERGVCVCGPRIELTATANGGRGVHVPGREGENGDGTLSIARTADLPFIRGLQKRFSNQLGFLPDAALREYVDRGRVLLCQDNGEPAGYLLRPRRLASLPSCVPLVQTAICYDAQRRALGLSLVEAAAAAALLDGRSTLQAWCRADIEATQFWRAAGFVAVAQRRTANARGHALILFRRNLLDDGQLPPLHLPRRAGCRGALVTHGELLTSPLRRRTATLATH